MYCTLICCMDGRFNMVINEYIRTRYRYVYVDTITDAGPVSKIINESYLNEIENKIVLISINKHRSNHIFVAGHHDCAGCPVDDKTQMSYIETAVSIIKKDLKDVKVTGMFVDEEFNVKIISEL